MLCTGGKRDEKLILPINSSLSVTLNQDEVSNSVVADIHRTHVNTQYMFYQLRATTSVMLSPSFSEDKLWINGR